jgi:hypothetical protein
MSEKLIVTPFEAAGDPDEARNGSLVRKRLREARVEMSALRQELDATRDGMVKFAMNANIMFAVLMQRNKGPLSFTVEELRGAQEESTRVRQRVLRDEQTGEDASLLLFLVSPEQAAEDFRRAAAAAGMPASKHTPDGEETSAATDAG